MNYLLELPLSLGIHGTYKGYRYLVFALELALSDENQLLYVTKNLYPSVARRYHTTPSRVDRDLRTVISQPLGIPAAERTCRRLPPTRWTNVLPCPSFLTFFTGI
ncbi:MAG: sporulation initiation factor Spo0A C-terminal domain-containing protein [Lachnospiraceae bacterium]